MSVTGTPIDSTSDVALVKSQGFDYEMLGFSTDAEFVTYLSTELEKAGRKVKGDVGATVYADDDEDIAAAVHDALVMWTVSRVWLRRKTVVLKAVSYAGEERVRAGLSEENAVEAALVEYEDHIARALTLSGVQSGFAVSAEVSSHFPETE